jgi:HlyD family secretion protein
MKKLLFLLPLFALVLTGCGNASAADGALTASGTISAREVNIASELTGRVTEVLVDEGQPVQAGDVLIRLDQSLLQAQLTSADAAIGLAEANLGTARAARDTAAAQFDLAESAAHQTDAPARSAIWKRPTITEIDNPGWYFDKPERLTAALALREAADANLTQAEADLQTFITGLNIPTLADVEARLAKAEISCTSAKAMRDLANQAADGSELRGVAQDAFDAACGDLDDIQQEMNDLLTDDQATDLLNARAKVALARQASEDARSRYDALLSGGDSLQLGAARAALSQAEAVVAQAEAGVTQAKAARDVLQVQLNKTDIAAPVNGILLTRSVEAGEMATPGLTLLVVGELDVLQLTVYVPENRYGEVSLGQTVSVSVDSFPDQVFTGKVVHIADQAEFTPRNVQTADGRRTTVFAIEISLPNPDLKLKPGMPADVVFGE